MAELNLDISDGDADRVVFEEPDPEGDMKFYLAGAGTGYLNSVQRRQLIDWLIRHTEDVIL